MKRYKLSFVLSCVLIVAAFIALYFEKSSESSLKNGASYFLFIGGFILGLLGQREYNEYKKLENKTNQNQQ